MKYAARAIAIDLCRAIDEDPNLVRTITLQLKPDNVLMVTVQKFVDKPDAILEVIKKYAWKEDK